MKDLFKLGHLSAVQILAARPRTMEEREEIDVLQLAELSSLLANAVQDVINLTGGEEGRN